MRVSYFIAGVYVNEVPRGNDDYSRQNPVRLSIISRAYSSDECRRRRQYVMSNVPGTLLIALYGSTAGSLPSHAVSFPRRTGIADVVGFSTM